MRLFRAEAFAPVFNKGIHLSEPRPQLFMNRLSPVAQPGLTKGAILRVRASG
jgi:hypothetical protein